MPDLLALGPRLTFGTAYEFAATLAELAPYRPRGLRVAPGDGPIFAQRNPSTELQRRRLIERLRLDPDADVPTLLALGRETAAFRIEFAIEVLGQRREAAALPVLAAVLDRPDPRVLGTDERVPLRAKAARAVLRIAATGDLARRAQAVLAGNDPEPGSVAPAVPEGARRRAEVLLAALRVREQRRLASGHLVRAGPAGAPVVVEALATTRDADVQEALLGVLQCWGPSVGECFNDSLAALLALLRAPPPHGVAALFDLLSQGAATSRDVLLTSALPPVLARVPGENADRWAASHLVLDTVDAEAAETARLRAAARLALPPWATEAEALEALRSADGCVVEQALLHLCHNRPLRAEAQTDVAAVLQRRHEIRVFVQGVGAASARRADVTDYLHALARAVIAEPPGRVRVR